MYDVAANILYIYIAVITGNLSNVSLYIQIDTYQCERITENQNKSIGSFGNSIISIPTKCSCRAVSDLICLWTIYINIRTNQINTNNVTIFEFGAIKCSTVHLLSNQPTTLISPLSHLIWSVCFHRVSLDISRQSRDFGRFENHLFIRETMVENISMLTAGLIMHNKSSQFMCWSCNAQNIRVYSTHAHNRLMAYQQRKRNRQYKTHICIIKCLIWYIQNIYIIRGVYNAMHSSGLS